VSAVSFWADLFVRHFIKAKEVSHDDMLFFVRKQAKKGTRYISQYEVNNSLKTAFSLQKLIYFSLFINLFNGFFNY
jgi:hypothetical protein